MNVISMRIEAAKTVDELCLVIDDYFCVPAQPFLLSAEIFERFNDFDSALILQLAAMRWFQLD